MSRAGIAALQSALLPGLGQARLGARRRGALIALPFAGILLVAAVAVIFDLHGAIDTILSPGVLVGVLVLIVAIGAYHLVAVLDAFRLGRRAPARVPAPATVPAPAPDSESPASQPQGSQPPTSRPPASRRTLGSPLLIVALAGVVALYGVIELVGVHAYQAASAIFVDPSTGFEIPASSFAPVTSPTPGAIPSGLLSAPPTATLEPGPKWAADGRLNLLLIGSDAGPGRWMARMDSINILSVDIATGRVALFGLWRYTGNVPLPPESAGGFKNGRFPGWLNALYVYAMGHPKQFPGGDAAGFRATAGAVQELIGQTIDGAVVVNLNGFVDLVDAVGGLWINIPFALHDPHYALPNGRGYIELNFRAGCQKLDGERALEYARTRHADSDYGRMRRQQRVMVALARELDPLALLPRVPELLDIARDNLWTTIQPDEIADLAQLAARVDKENVQYYLFWPPDTPQHLNNAGIQHVRDVVAGIFDAPTPSSEPTPKPTAEPKACPRP